MNAHLRGRVFAHARILDEALHIIRKPGSVIFQWHLANNDDNM